MDVTRAASNDRCPTPHLSAFRSCERTAAYTSRLARCSGVSKDLVDVPDVSATCAFSLHGCEATFLTKLHTCMRRGGILSILFLVEIREVYSMQRVLWLFLIEEVAKVAADLISVSPPSGRATASSPTNYRYSYDISSK